MSCFYRDPFLSGLRELKNQRGLFESFVRSVLGDLGEEISAILLNRVVFQWRKDVLGIYCPHTGAGRDFAQLTLIDGRDSLGKWEPILCLLLLTGDRDERRWEVTSRSDVEEMFAGMIATPPVAVIVAKVGGGLQVGDRDDSADLPEV